MIKISGFSMCCSIAAICLALATFASPVRAQETEAELPPAAKPNPELEAAARKFFKAFVDGDLDTIKSMTVKRYGRHLTKEMLRPVETGPKLSLAFDGKVNILRAGPEDAIVEADIFKPLSKEIPPADAQKLVLYMVNEDGQWLVDAPKRKQAGSDATVQGGWFHPGRFTWCPNKGLAYQGSHFSNKLYDRTTAVCR
jgi:hypothetical protein